MKIAIDFDDTIHDRSNIKPGYKMGTPMPGALETITDLVNNGVEVYILTASTKARMKSIEDWLDFFGFPPLHVTDHKTNSDYFIDDRAIKFESWGKVREILING